MRSGTVLCRLRLQFESRGDLREDLSAVALAPDGSLWLAADEKASIERMSPVDQRTFGEHRSFVLADHVDLAETGAEADLEGLSLDGGYLWFLGSHSTKRVKPRGKADDVARLAAIASEPSRFLVARIPVTAEGDLAAAVRAGGRKKQSAKVRPGRAKVETTHGTLDAGNLLFASLHDDPHLGPFLAAREPGSGKLVPLPSKDNGLDIEGLVVLGHDAALGLRGPVLRGWAVLLRVDVRDASPGELKLADLPNGRRYVKHFLDLDGLGVRELTKQGEDLLILAGPTMTHDGPHYLYRYRGWRDAKDDVLVEQKKGRLERLFEVPSGAGCDRPEGIVSYSYFDENDAVLVVYDTPSPERLHGPAAVLADVFRLRER